MNENYFLLNVLLPYQQDAVDKLYKLKVGALFMEQGTGKTITALELCRKRLVSCKITHFIWLCPCSAKQNIKEELLKHCPDEMLNHVTICGIETLSTSINVNSYLLMLAQKEICFLIVDESLLTKNPQAYRTKHIIQISKHCPYRLILNGSPISRNEADLFSQFYILDWRILGYQSYWSFSANHLEYDEQNSKRIVRTLNTDYLARKISPYTFQIKKKDCLSLPDKHYQKIYFNLEEEQFLHYQDISNQLLFELDELKPETIYRLFTALQSIACGHRITFFEGKNGYKHLRSIPFFYDSKQNPRMQQLLNLLNNKSKAIIFCNYTDEITEICNVLNQKYGNSCALRFDGNLSIKKRNQNLKLFSKDSTYLIANRNCAGYSLNLQFCNTIIYYSNDWNLATRIQSEDRVHRIGQEHNVNIFDLCANQTIDVRIQKCLQKKENLLDAFKHELNNGVNKEYIRNWLNIKLMKNRRIYDCLDLCEQIEGSSNA